MTHLEICTKKVLQDGICVELCDHKTTPEHKHCFFELVYVLKGQTNHFFEGKEILLNAGDYFLIDINHSHSFFALSSEEEFQIINCMFLPSFIDKTLTNTHRFGDLINNYLSNFNYSDFENQPTKNIYHDTDKKILFLIMQILTEYDARRREYMEIIRAHLSAILIHLLRNELTKEDSGRDIVHYIKKYVNNHYTQPLSLSNMCKNVNYSLSNISIMFAKSTGMTFSNYVRHVRINKSLELLKKSDKSISEIARLLGYSDPAFFYRIFKKEMNMTPREYRQKYCQLS